jgi:uncharacterized protein involved in exopolysaccharide biosynthesis
MEKEITFKDVLDLLIESRIIIIISGFLGLLAALGFLMVTPNKFEAVAKIQMARLSPEKILTWVNAEDPNLLLYRLKSPSSYSAVEIKACDLDNEKVPNESLVELLNIFVPKGLNNTLELRVSLTAKETAYSCALAIFEYIRESQNQMNKIHIDRAKGFLMEYRPRLKEVINHDSLGGPGQSISSTFLPSRDDLKPFSEEILRLNNLINNVEQAKLISPIHVLDTPIFRKTFTAIGIGFFAGLLLGFMLAVIRRISINYKLS